MRLEENPFYILGVGVNGTKADIMQKADDKCFEEPELENEIEKAKGILLNPQRRIAAEIRWFPGCCGSTFQQNLAEKFQELNIYAMSGNALCKLNILLVQVNEAKHVDDIVNKIVAIDDVYSKISLEDIRQWINRDRNIAKFPEIQDVQQLENAWQEYRQDIRQQLQDKCQKKLHKDEFASVAINVAKKATVHGQSGPVVQDFIAMYDLSVAKEKEKCYDKAIEALDSFFKGENNSKELNSALRCIMNISKPVCILNDSMGIDTYPLAAGVYNKLNDIAPTLWDNGEPEKAIHLLEIAKVHFEGINAFMVRINADLQKARRNYKAVKDIVSTPVVTSSPPTSSSTAPSTKTNTPPTRTNTSTSSYRTTTSTSSSTTVNRSGQLSPDKGSSSDSSSEAIGCCGCLGALVFLGIGGAVAGPVGCGIAAVIMVALAVSDD